MKAVQRDKWSSKVGFVLAAAGSAIGLGNIWKFPYSVGVNGGGAYVALYLLFLVIIGIPLMLAAITLGRKTQLSVFGAYKSIDKRWSFAGALAVICGFVILAFYSTVGGWVLFYLKNALLGNLNSKDPAVLGQVFSDMMNSPKTLVLYQAIFLLLTMLIVVNGIKKGIENSSKVMMPALFILLLIIAVRSVTLSGSMEGIKFLLVPDFSKLNMDVAKNAMGQMFFSLSIGMGVMITYGSYLDKEVDLLSTAVSIPLLDTLAAMIAGFATIPAVFALGFEVGEGPGLMFVTLPAVFASMPMGQFFCIAFFLMVTFASLTSSMSMLEISVSYFVDEWKKDRKTVTLIVGLVVFLMGIPASLSLVEGSGFRIGSLGFFDIYDKLTSNILLTTGGFLLCIFVAWVLTTKEAIKEIEISGTKFKLADMWSFLVKYIVPVGIFIILAGSYKDFILSLLQ